MLKPAAPYSAAANTLQSGVRFYAQLDEALSQVLPRWVGCQRVIYNAKVEEDHLFAAQRRLVLRDGPQAVVHTPLDQCYSHFKDDELTPWLSEVPSQVLTTGWEHQVKPLLFRVCWGTTSQRAADGEEPLRVPQVTTEVGVASQARAPLVLPALRDKATTADKAPAPTDTP